MKKHDFAVKKKKSLPFPLILFRMMLSLVMFAILLGGAYSAYKYFSGTDPLRFDPQTSVLNFISSSGFNRYIPTKFLPKGNIAGEKVERRTGTSSSNNQPDNPDKFSFLLVGDSHNENDYLKKAIEQAKVRDTNLKFIIGLGDYTEVGTLEELQTAKRVFDNGGLRYFLTAGDHDLWDGRDKQGDALADFTKVFGKPYQTFTFEGVKFLILNNSDNYIGLGEDQRSWLNLELERLKQDSGINLTFVFLHEPLYHPTSIRVMGKTDSKIKDQADLLIRKLAEAGVKQVFAGDIHYFSQYKDPQTNLAMTTIGAVASVRNVQKPRYTLVTVYQDFSFHIDDIEIE